jgi:hypothetical protein
MKKALLAESGRQASAGTPWQARVLKPETCYHLSFGPLRLWLRQEGREWYVAREYRPNQSGGGLLEALPGRAWPPDVSWQRWVIGEADAPVRLRPELPDRPVVVRPEQPLRLSAGSQVRVFVAIPIYVSILVGGAKPITLTTLATRILSNTWFGESASGELCYALISPAVMNADGLAAGAHEALCPVTILNRSAGELDFQRICIRVEHLGIYRGVSRLWTNGMRVEYRGEPGVGQVTISGKVPQFEEVKEKLTEARRPMSKTLMTKSFHLLKSLTGF